MNRGEDDERGKEKSTCLAIGFHLSICPWYSIRCSILGKSCLVYFVTMISYHKLQLFLY